MIVPNILVSVSGLPKTGKTYLGLTFPPPIKVFSFDLGADFVCNKFFAGKEVTIKNFYLPIVESEEEDWALPIWKEFYPEYNKDVNSGKFKTLVLDTATAVEAICRQTVLEEIKEDKPTKKKLGTTEYLGRNLRMGALFARAKVAGVNLVTIQYLREQWMKVKNSDRSEPTGELIIDGWNQTEGQVDINIEMTTKEKAGKKVMVATIKSNRFDRDVDGRQFEDLTYEELVALLFGG